MNIIGLYDLSIHSPQITADSRNYPKGSIFSALKGNKFGGNQCVGKALASGYVYTVIDNPDRYIGERTIPVDNMLKALQQLAHHHRKVLGLPIVGITGTNGKTTTKELLTAVLSAKFDLLYTESNFNIHIGVPLTLFRLIHDHEMAVIEMGASYSGDIKESMDIVHSNYGIVTSVGRAHLEGFSSFEGVIRTRGELYGYIRRSKGKIFIKKESEHLQFIAKGIEQIMYGNGDSAFAPGQVISCDPFLMFNWERQGKLHTVETRMISSYNLGNVLTAVAIGRFLKIPTEHISRAVTAYEPTSNRFQSKKIENDELIIDAYNANPSNMKVALDNFITMPTQPKAIILGDMCELGSTGDGLHVGVVEQIKKNQFDKMFLRGEHFSRIGKKFSPFATTEVITGEFRRWSLKGYHILVRGSHSVGLERLTDIL